MKDLEDFEPAYDSNEHYICDWCSTGVSYSQGKRISHYLCDKLITGDDLGEMTILATYCPDCTSRLLYFPCEGYSEIRVVSELTEDRKIKNPEITDRSPTDDGIPWDPLEIHNEITTLPPKIAESHAREIQMAPENMITFLESVFYELSAKSIINPDGSIDDTILKLAREEFKQFMKEARREGFKAAQG